MKTKTWHIEPSHDLAHDAALLVAEYEPNAYISLTANHENGMNVIDAITDEGDSTSKKFVRAGDWMAEYLRFKNIEENNVKICAAHPYAKLYTSAWKRGYVKKSESGRLEEYNGRYGTGYTEHLHSKESSKYYIIRYYID